MHRKEDAVGFGWCWWHRSCFSCLICASPFPPPTSGPESNGAYITNVPVCKRCARKPSSVKKLEQHTRPTASITERSNKKRTITPADWEGRIHLDSPLDQKKDYHFPGYDKRRTPHNITSNPSETLSGRPAWMRLLPSNINPHVKPPSHSALHRRSTFPYIQHTRWSPSNRTPNLTPPETPKAQGQNALTMSTAMQGSGKMSSLMPTPDPGVSLDKTAVPAAETAPQSIQQHESEATNSNHSFHQSVATPTAVEKKQAATVSPVPSPTDNQQRHPNKLRKRSSARDRARQLSLRRQYSEAQNTVQSDNTSVTSTMRKLSLRRKSTRHDDQCHEKPHTPVPSQDITPAKQPFFREMLTYFTNRSDAGKQILPSRVSEGSGRETLMILPACLTCGKPIGSHNAHGLATRCERCKLRTSEAKVSTSVFGVDLPGAWSPGRS